VRLPQRVQPGDGIDVVLAARDDEPRRDDERGRARQERGDHTKFGWNTHAKSGPATLCTTPIKQRPGQSIRTH
jgi:hypothetical protein